MSESKWRENVTEYGWADSPVQLFARLVPRLDTAIGKWVENGVTKFAFFQNVLPGEVAELVGVSDLSPGWGHFPYIFDVEPDH